MPEHISRKELKTDEFRETLAHGAEAVLSHQQLALYVVGAIAIVALAVFGWRFYAERQTVKAAAAYDDAMKVFKARIRTAGEPAGDPSEITYSEDKNKYDDADKKFEAVAKQYSRTRPGQISAYYAALCLEHLNRDLEAQKWLEQVINSGDPDFVSLARLELAQLDDRNNKAADAEKIYQDLVAHPFGVRVEAGGIDGFCRSLPADEEFCGRGEALQRDQDGISRQQPRTAGRPATGFDHAEVVSSASSGIRRFESALYAAVCAERKSQSKLR